MKTLYIDCRSGMSGDMMLGAMLDLGVPQEVLETGLEALGVHEFHLDIKKRQDTEGNSFTDVDVILDDAEKTFVDPYSGRFRNYGDIKKLIDDSHITSTAKELGRKIFDIKAAAEALAHGVSEDEVQFHEAGAVDSIVDIIGTAICFDHIGANRVISTPVPTGYGTVKCAFGELPVPAPATKAILEERNLSYYRSDIPQEVLTPTGAAIIAGLVGEFVAFDDYDEAGSDRNFEKYEFSRVFEGSLAGMGQGTGKRETGLPPLRLYLCT